MDYSLRQRRLLWLYTFVCPAIDKFARMIRDLGPPEELFETVPDALSRYVSAEQLTRMRRLNSEQYIDALLERLRARGVTFVCRGDADYPECLEELDGMIVLPELLFVRGERDLNISCGISVVGTRKCSDEGARIARSFGRDFAQAGAQVVTGMAVGIDAAAVEGALEGGGRVIGVLGCGVDVPYPAQNQVLVRRMLESGGSLISEYMPGMAANHIYFPLRNRIIAGLTRGTLIVEAPARSGALNTASHALNIGHEVFVVPGSILDARYAGSNALLLEGAAPALTSFDVLEPLGIVELDDRARFGTLSVAEETAPRYDANAGARGGAAARDEGARAAAGQAGAGTSRKAGSDKPAEQRSPARRVRSVRSAGAGVADAPEPVSRPMPELTGDERRIVELLQKREHSFDEMISQTDFDTATLNSLLTMLKIKRIIYETTGKHFRIDDTLR